MKKQSIAPFVLLFLLFIVLAALRPVLRMGEDLQARPAFRLTKELLASHLRINTLDSLPDFDGHYFVSAGVCDNCHAKDPNGVALVDQFGTDVNMVDEWRSTMMALSAKDPFWLAQVSHEVLTNPSHQVVLEDKCSQCHAPLGRYSHYYESGGQAIYSMAMLAGDTLGLDGVSCMSCHSQRPDSFGTAFSGQLFLDTTRAVYGQYPGPVVAPMFTANHLNVAYGPHIQESKLCAGCHTLVTETVDLSGTPTGGSFAEQATYHEWLNSTYYTNDINCQTCHMPSINDFIYLSGPHVSSTNPRRPYGQHHFAGANSFMLRMMKQYKDSLELAVENPEFDSTLARTDRMLKSAVRFSCYETFSNPDTMAYVVNIENLSGHKFPTGYPSRRVYIEFIATTVTGDTLLQSGRMRGDGSLVGQNPTYEPHHQVIRDSSQVQIYEMVMADVNGNVTTTLERAANPLKDNRITPTGFSSGHQDYNLMQVAGLATQDYQYTNQPGLDAVEYLVPLNGYQDTVKLSIKLYYQTVPRRWLDETFSHSSPAIDRFERWFDNSAQAPELVAALSESDLLLNQDQMQEPTVMLYPNPNQNGQLKVILPTNDQEWTVSVYDLSGRLVMTQRKLRGNSENIQLPAAKGYYMVELASEGYRKSFRVRRD